MDRIGTFLSELSDAERSHAIPPCQRIDFTGHDLAQLSQPAGSCTISVDADRQIITHALQALSTEAATTPDAPHPDPTALVQQRWWAEVLHDLGQYSADMASLCRARPPGRTPWRYQRIERTGTAVAITDSNGREQLTHTIDLDTSRPPAAVPLTIAETVAASAPGRCGRGCAA
ncbi:MULTISPECIES: ROK family protein [Citricoccus]|uniref:ROK family protein n=1 Tax=Citricoccus TaxID=169133 RepID=UPI000255F19B|nr:ROK family protein [Citricoccus sp. CH26A]